MTNAEWEKAPCRVCGREIGPIRDPRAPNVCERPGCYASWMRLQEWRQGVRRSA